MSTQTITSAVRINYDHRTGVIQIVSSNLSPQSCAALSREPYTIEGDNLMGWGYTHRISVDPMLSYDFGGDYLVTFAS